MSTDDNNDAWHSHEAGKRQLDRMLFFSDAVFAIVLTLLVLELRPPEGIGELAITVGSVLGAMARNLFSFFISFALVALWWFVHMRITRPLLVFDGATAFFNIVFLLTVTLVPFVSALVTAYGKTSAAWEIYWGVNAASSLSLALLWLVSSRGKGRLMGGTTARARVIGFVRTLIPGFCFAIGIGLAMAGYTRLALWSWIPIPLLIFAINRFQRRYG